MGTVFFGPSIDTESGSETAIQEVLLSAGTVSNLRAYLIGGTPGSGDSYTFAVRRDPAGAPAPSNTGITCTISDVASTCTDTTHTQAFSAGDAISLVATEGGKPQSLSVMFRLDVKP
jgi:hypothetical protein